MKNYNKIKKSNWVLKMTRELFLKFESDKLGKRPDSTGLFTARYILNRLGLKQLSLYIKFIWELQAPFFIRRNNMEFKLGKYKIKGKHKGCKHKGIVMELSLNYIDGKPFPPNNKIEWLWCNGSIWNGERHRHERCGASNYKNKKTKVEVK